MYRLGEGGFVLVVCETIGANIWEIPGGGVTGRSRNTMLGCPRLRRGDGVGLFWKKKEM